MYLYIILCLIIISYMVTVTISNKGSPHGPVDQWINEQEVQLGYKVKNLEENGKRMRNRSNKTDRDHQAEERGSLIKSGSYSLPDQWRKLSEDVNLQSVNTFINERNEAHLVNHLQVRVAAVAENIEVLVDDVAVYSVPAEESFGFHVLALSPWDGRMLLTRHFDTGQLGDGVLMRSCLASLQPGTLVVLIPMFNAGDNLGTTEKFLIEKLGMEGYGVGGATKRSLAPYLEEVGGTAKSGHASNLKEVGRVLNSGPISNLNEVKGALKLGLNHHTNEVKNTVNSPNYSGLPLKIDNASDVDVRPFAVEEKMSRYYRFWNGYIHSEDPCVLISEVPQEWPPEHKEKSLMGKVYAEIAIIFIGNRLKIGNLEMTVLVPQRKAQHCPWHDNPARAAQLRFCSLYEGYGALCRCQDPIIPERLRRSAPPIAMTEDIPVAMLTAKKSFFFYRQLVNLLTTAGAAQTSILVLIDGYHKETAQLAELFGLPTVIHTHGGATGTYTPLNEHFRFSVHRVFSFFTNSSKAIILEDDLLLSPDFLSFFQQTARLLDADPSLYCVNSFSLNSYATAASDVGRLKRVELFPQFGWMVTRKWAEELLPLWVSNRVNLADWDWWLNGAARNKGRHAIVPEVSRSFHSGSSGSHVPGALQAMVFSNMIYNQDPEAKLRDLNLLLEKNYEKFIVRELQSAIRLPGSFNPCYPSSFPKHLAPGHVLMSILVNNISKDDGIETVARCLHAFPRPPFEAYKGVMQFTLTRVTPHRRLYVLACPLSPYCSAMGNLSTHVVSPDIAQLVRSLDDRWRLRQALGEARQLYLFNRSSLTY